MLVRQACYTLSYPQNMVFFSFVCVLPLTMSASLSELRLLSVPPEGVCATGRWEKGERKHFLSDDSPSWVISDFPRPWGKLMDYCDL